MDSISCNELSVQDMRKFIYEKVKILKDTSDIYDFAQLNCIPGTINNNGIFINLTALSEDYVRLMYDKTKYYTEFKHKDINEILENTNAKLADDEIIKKAPIKQKQKKVGKNLSYSNLESTILTFCE